MIDTAPLSPPGSAPCPAFRTPLLLNSQQLPHDFRVLLALTSTPAAFLYFIHPSFFFLHLFRLTIGFGNIQWLFPAYAPTPLFPHIPNPHVRSATKSAFHIPTVPAMCFIPQAAAELPTVKRDQLPHLSSPRCIDCISPLLGILDIQTDLAQRQQTGARNEREASAESHHLPPHPTVVHPGEGGKTFQQQAAKFSQDISSNSEISPNLVLSVQFNTNHTQLHKRRPARRQWDTVLLLEGAALQQSHTTHRFHSPQRARHAIAQTPLISERICSFDWMCIAHEQKTRTYTRTHTHTRARARSCAGLWKQVQLVASVVRLLTGEELEERNAP